MSKQKLSDKYKELEPREHVLHRPETYVGSILTEDKELFLLDDIYNTENIKFTKKIVKYNPAFIKLFDEIIVNAADHYTRTDGKVKNIRITVEQDNVSIYNDGPGIPIEIHDTKKVWLPEMLFGRLMSGENFNDNEKRYTGGRNGYGASLCNIFSKKFIIDCADGKNSYYQVFSENLLKKTKPKVEECKKSYTKITYFPDFERFSLTEIDSDIVNIFFKRAIDIAMYCTGVNVYFNDQLIKFKNFKDFIKLYTKDEQETFYEKIDDKWEIGLTKTDYDQFEQISIINGISTYDGGTHVNFITGQIVTAITELLQKKYKKGKINPNDIKRNLFLFLNCKIPNPAFTSQTKETLITKIVGDIAKDVIVSDSFIKKIMNSDILQNIINYIEAKELAQLKKENKKNSKVKIKKLDDANKAGTDESSKCLLHIAEGDSASSMLIAGFSEVSRDYFGVIALKGKPLNVRNANLTQIKDNEEIKNIIMALGLEYGKKYEDLSELRYGKVVFTTDQDVDGFHIKGLLINLISNYWPELLKLDFIYEFITPIISINKNEKVKYFYKLQDFKDFTLKNSMNGYFTKYYKGLGTILPSEAKLFFKNIDKHLIKFEYDNENTEELVDLIFNNKRANERKTWLTTYKANNIIDKFQRKTTYDNFINDELIEFSMHDNVRSIPNMVDGLKPSQRKILYTLLLKNLTNEIKVSQLTGAIIENAAYHNGSVSLEEAIIGMSQDYIGSNNINLLLPKGQFGTRLCGGNDNAASRYIFTKLNNITRKIFVKDDDNILNYLVDDNKEVEPNFYLPIIPMILVNGAKGVGTAYSTDIPSFDVNDIIKWLYLKLKSKKTSDVQLRPYYKNFTGEIIDDGDNKYITRGIIEKVNTSTLRILELPIGVWTTDYYEHLDSLIDDKIIKDYNKKCSDTKIDIEISMTREKVIELFDSGDDKIYKIFKLESKLNLNNMILFNSEGILKKYNYVSDILEEFFNYRLLKYADRKDYLIQQKKRDLLILNNRIKFIKDINSNNIIINNKSKVEVENKLVQLAYDKVDDSYGYLLDMKLYSLTKEKIVDLENEFKKEEVILNEISNISIETMWLNDLQELKKAL